MAMAAELFVTNSEVERFNHLVLEHQNLVYNQAYRMLGDRHSAEDAAQEAFTLAYRNLRYYRGGSFRAWLLRIVMNLCYDELRRRKRRKVIPLEPLNQQGDEVESPYWLGGLDETPEEAAERGDLQRDVQRCLEELPPDFRTVVLLVDMLGLDYHEAAAVIGKPQGTVKSRLARARGRLRERMSGYA